MLLPALLLQLDVILATSGQGPTPLSAPAAEAAITRYNIAFILTDDQDLTLASLDYMPKTRQLLGMVEFTNMFATTPVCCPSRSSYLSGMYQHNTRCLANSVGAGCDGPAARVWEAQAMAVHLRKVGYHTGFWGKYLNTYGTPGAGRGLSVPPGWSEWGGLVGNSRYYDYNMSINGEVEVHHSDYSADYFTDLISRRANAWVANVSAAGEPFFAVLSTPACHDGTIPAPQYSNVSLLNGTTGAPRTGNFNTGTANKHHFASGKNHPTLGAAEIEYLDVHYLRRLLTLQSVDDLVESLVATLERTQVLDKTCIIYTSDHGYHHGQFSQVIDKRNPYEEDVRIPLLVHPPTAGRLAGAALSAGNAGHIRVENLVLAIDVAPTVLELAGVPAPASMDGRSWVPLLQTKLGLGSSVTEGFDSSHRTGSALPWRHDALIEYWGESFGSWGAKQDVFHYPPVMGPDFKGFSTHPGFIDETNNTWSCLRTLHPGEDSLYCVFWKDYSDVDDPKASPYFVEHYNIAEDPWQINNTVAELSTEDRTRLSKRLEHLRHCKGATDCQ